LPDESKGPGLSLDSISLERRPVAQKILDAFAAAGFGQFQQVAALANAIAESGLDPNVHLSVAEDSWGLFLLNTQRGFGTGHSAEELRNPDVNIGIMVKEAQKNSAFAAATSLDAAVEIFVRQIERPKNVASEGNKSRDKFAELSADQNDHRECRCPHLSARFALSLLAVFRICAGEQAWIRAASGAHASQQKSEQEMELNTTTISVSADISDGTRFGSATISQFVPKGCGTRIPRRAK
jgi:hypothetical protein